MKSLDELKQIKEKVLAEMQVREGTARTRIVVGMGTCGIAVGAREVLLALMDELSRRKLGDILVTQSGCPGPCEQEPIVEVRRQGEPVYVYGRVTPEMARQIIHRHLVNNQPVKNWLVRTENTGAVRGS